MTVAMDACPCGAPVEAAYQRHLTQAEYDALPEGLKPIDGYATIAVRVCGDCHPGPICEHPDTAPVPCPTCNAQPGQSCTKPDGSLRPVEHPQRATAQPVPETCRHAHRETCTDPRHCACTGDDPQPARAPRIIVPPSQQAQLADLGMPPGLLMHAAQWAAEHGIDPGKVRGGFRTGYTQDNRPAILFDYATGTDSHGRETVQLRIEPIETPQ